MTIYLKDYTESPCRAVLVERGLESVRLVVTKTTVFLNFKVPCIISIFKVLILFLTTDSRAATFTDRSLETLSFKSQSSW